MLIDRFVFLHTSWISSTNIYQRYVAVIVEKKQTDEGISSFQAFALAISGRVGTGDIIGVGTAIYMGRSGAILLFKPLRWLFQVVWVPEILSE